MREASQSHFFGIDIGTTTVKVVVGMHDEARGDQISVIGHGTSKNSGLRKGAIVHIDETADAIINAVTEAERLSGVSIKHATVNINGSTIHGIDSTGVIAISSSDREITEEDRFRVEEAAAIVQLPPNQEIIQVFAKNYRVDGQDNIKDPVGMQGVRLEVDTHIVSAAASSQKSLASVMSKAHIGINHVTVSSLAAAEVVLTRSQKEAGTILLDIGAGTTNLVVVEDGEVHYVGVIPVGGIHVTNDLAIGLRTDLEVAEKVKLEHASLIPGKHKEIGVDIDNSRHSFNSYDVQMIVGARIEELFELVEKQLKTIGKSGKLPGGVVLVGGTANIPGLDILAKEKLELASRIGKVQNLQGLIDVIDTPTFATSIGLMQLDMFLTPQNSEPAGAPNQNVFGALEGILNKFKRKSH